MGCDSSCAPFGCGKRGILFVKGRFKELSNLGASAESSNISEELMDTLRPKEQNRRHQWFEVQIKCEKGTGELEAAANQKQGTILHVYRANYQCYIWKNAQRPFLSLPYPAENGWIKSDEGKLDPTLMTNLAVLVPENLIELTVCRCRKKCINNTCHCRKVSLSWIESCSCEESCMDPYKENITSILMCLTN